MIKIAYKKRTKMNKENKLRLIQLTINPVKHKLDFKMLMVKISILKNKKIKIITVVNPMNYTLFMEHTFIFNQ
ncbi:hypothetical protein SOASR032_30160 [Pragia fontium]|uniref:Uncharacterized protein n=1 Tax=Pragia fontium TaxID=82985 RepID=A0ABQ5LNK5_9GAMM|nr:hypothetical protein SOASR032_30160 [Pragia fontium]